MNVNMGVLLEESGVRPGVEEQADVVLQSLTFRARTTRSDVETGNYRVSVAEEAMEGKEEGGRLVE
jgi:hypothetical protein